MYLWRRRASQKWWSDHEEGLRAAAGDRLAIIEQAGRKRLELEVTRGSRSDAQKLAKEFGGRVEKLPRDWLKRFSHEQQIEPIGVGKRLVIVRSRKDRQSTKELIIPAGTAFGTGEHATTAMSLRMLEKLTRRWKPGWSIIDLGTGSGILALAAKHLGAKQVMGIDSDPIAISIATQNARSNKIGDVKFRVGDVRRWKSRARNDIVTANLFSELLIEILPKLKAPRWMILSGILRNQERDVTRAVRRHKIDIVQVRRRGKWVAILTAVR
jgi:ribosomal protein L11 methyltransferase